MTDNPQDRPEERRRSRFGRSGPLGDDSDETRQIPSDEPRQGSPRGQREGTSSDSGDYSDDETRPVEMNRESGGETSGRDDTVPGGVPREEEKETRIIRTQDSSRDSAFESRDSQSTRRGGSPYTSGYFESAEEREDRLRDIHGGLDWLASFLGFIFAAVAGSALFGLAGLVLVPLGVTVEIGGQIGAAAITAIVLLAVLVFVTYLFGGYVAGRLARFDGGRNGAMTVVWGIFIGLLLFAVGAFLPGATGESIRNFLQGSILPGLGSLLDLGVIGIAVAIGAVAIALLGGLVGGRLGERYHSDIDHTT